MNPEVVAQGDGQGGALLCSASGASLPFWARTQEEPPGKARRPQLLLSVFPPLRERQMRSAPVVSRNSSATGSNKTGAAGPGRAGSVEDQGSSRGPRSPGHTRVLSLLPRTWRPAFFLAWVVSRGPSEGPWGKGAHAQS